MKRSRLQLVSSVVLTTVIFNSSLAFADTTDSIKDKIDQNKQSIEDIQKQRDNINKQKNDQQKGIDDLLKKIGEEGSKLTAINVEVNKYQEEINKTQQELNDSQNKINTIQDEVEHKKLLIKEKEKEESDSQEKLGKRIRNYYKVDIASEYIYMIIKSESISNLFNNIQSVFRIMNMDKELVEKAKEVKAELIAENKALDKKISEIQEEQNAIVKNQDKLKEDQKVVLAKQEEQKAKVDELNGLENQKQDMIASLSDKDKELAGQGKDLVANNSELEAQLQQILNNINNNDKNNSNNSNNNNDSGNQNNNTPAPTPTPGNPSQEGFIRPGSGPVTDPYGHRINPVTGKDEYHKGVDLGDPAGSQVHAAKSGTVSYAGWMSGYGNVVIIDHGNGVQTLYGHNQQVLVSVGQQVSQGQAIALVGSTGQSTGPHIHWEIRVNGQPTDPMGYV